MKKKMDYDNSIHYAVDNWFKKAVNDYCQQNDITLSQLNRKALMEFFEKRNIKLGVENGKAKKAI